MAGTTDAAKSALLADIAATRGELTGATERLRESMDVPARIRKNMQQNRARWVIGASTVALALVLLRRRRKVVYVERSSDEVLGVAGKAGLVLTTLKLIAGAAKPLLGELAKTRLADLAARFAQHRGGRAAEQTRHR